MQDTNTLDSVLDAVSLIDLSPVFTEYVNDPEGAIERLIQEKRGDARAVWTRQGLDTMDLIWGNAHGGLAHILAKHPDMRHALPRLRKTGKLIAKLGARKVFLVDDRDPPNVVVIALDGYGASKTWVVTSYEDAPGAFTGSLKRIDTAALDFAWVEVLYANQRTSPSIIQAFEKVKP